MACVKHNHCYLCQHCVSYVILDIPMRNTSTYAAILAQPGGSEVLVNRRNFDDMAGFTLFEAGLHDGEQLQKWIEQYGTLTVNITVGGKMEIRSVTQNTKNRRNFLSSSQIATSGEK